MLPVSETEDKEAKTKTITFAPSPIMSTYLVAMVVGNLLFPHAFLLTRLIYYGLIIISNSRRV